jgi:hypothetical protein
MSRYRPQPILEGADYSAFDRFEGSTTEPGGEVVIGTDLKLLLEDIRFCSSASLGLELVDIVTNALRRALLGRLRKTGWRHIPRLMIHRNEPCIKFMLLRDGPSTGAVHHPAYAPIVCRAFARGGRQMLAPRFLRAAKEG